MASRDLHVNIDANTKPYQKAMSQASTASGNFQRSSSKSFQRVGTKMKNVGTTLTKRVTLPLAAAGAASVKAAVDWETAWTGVTKTIDGTDEQMADLEEGLREMAKRLPASHEEIAAVAEAAGQLGVGVEDAEEFTETMVDLGETTNLTAEEAAMSLAEFANIMGTPLDEVESLGSAIVELGNNSATTEKDILDMGTRMAAAGEIAGLSESDVLAFAAAASSVGVEAEAGGTALSKAFQEIDDAVKTGGDNLEIFSEIAGVSAEEFATAFREDPAEAIATFIEGLGRINEQGGSTTEQLDEVGLGGIRVRQALLSTAEAGPLLADALEMSEQAMDDNTALSEEAAKRYGTLESRMKAVRDQVVDLGIQFGEAIIPALETLIPFVEDLVGWFSDLPDPVKSAVVALGGLVAVFGPLMAGFGSIITNGKKVAGAITAIGTALTAHPWLGAAAGIAAVGFALKDLLVGVEVGEDAEAIEEAISGLIDRVRRAEDPFDEFSQHVEDTMASSDPFREAMKETGLSVDDVTEAMTGSVEEFSNLQNELLNTDAAQKSDEAYKALSEVLTTLRTEGVTVEDVMGDLEQIEGALADETDDTSKSIQEQAEAQKKAAEEAQDAKDALSDLQDTVANLSDKFEKAQDRANRMQTAFDDVFGVTMNAEEAAIAYEQSIDDLSESIEENGTTLDISTQKGRDNREAIKGVSDEILNNIDVLTEQGKTNKEVRETVNGQIEGLKEQMRQLGFTEEQVQSHIDTLGLTPENVNTSIQLANQRKAREELEEHLNRLDEIPPEKASEIQTLIDQGKLKKARQELDNVSEPRESEMQPEVNQGLKRSANDTLWGIAQTRNSRMDPRINQHLAGTARDTLWGIAQTRNSRMDPRINKHLAGTARDTLWGIAQTRNSRMDPRINHSLADSANDTLWGIAQTRNSTMWARPDNVGSTEGTLNNVARTRTATINVQPNLGNFFGAIPGFASGGRIGVNDGPVQIVGERGPELVSLPAGSEVHTAAETRGMVSDVSSMTPVSGGGSTVHNNGDIHVHPPPGSDGDEIVRALQRVERRRGPLPFRTRQ